MVVRRKGLWCPPQNNPCDVIFLDLARVFATVMGKMKISTCTELGVPKRIRRRFPLSDTNIDTTRFAIILPFINKLPHTDCLAGGRSTLFGPGARRVLIEICLVNKNCINKILLRRPGWCLWFVFLHNNRSSSTACHTGNPLLLSLS